MNIEDIIPIYDSVHKVIYYVEALIEDAPYKIKELDDRALIRLFSKYSRKVHRDFGSVSEENLIELIQIAKELKNRSFESYAVFNKIYDFQEDISDENGLSKIILAESFYLTPPSKSFPKGMVKRFI